MSTQEPAVRFEALQVVITREDQDSDYEIRAIDSDGVKKTFHAGALNINGMAMATGGLEIGEYRGAVIIEKDRPDSRYLNLNLQPPEGDN